MNQKQLPFLLILCLFLFSSCSLFRSKYVTIETQEGRTYTVYKTNIKEERLIASSNVSKAAVTFILKDQKDRFSSDDGWFYIFQLTNQYEHDVSYPLHFAYDSILTFFVREGSYKVSLIGDNGQQLDIPVGHFTIEAGQEKEFQLWAGKITTTASYSIKKKVLRRKFRQGAK